MKNKGITLIALIITIIILLILAGTTISMLTGENGILNRAENSKEKTVIREEKEQISLAWSVVKIDKLGGIVTAEELEKELNKKATVKEEDSKFKITFKETGNIHYIDAEGKYISTGEGEDEYDLLANKVEVGDYVAYDATDNYNYKSTVGTGTSHGNGYADQTFTSSSDVKWKVLSKDTKSGEVVLISETGIGNVTGASDGTSLMIKGVIGYLYAEQEINNICAIYGHGVGADTSKTFTYKIGDTAEGLKSGTITGSGARSLNIDDIDEITGFDTSNDSNYYYGRTSTLTNRYFPTLTTSSGITSSKIFRTYTETSYYGTKEVTDGSSTTYKSLDGYELNSFLNETDDIYKVLNCSGSVCWLASRFDAFTGYNGKELYDNQYRMGAFLLSGNKVMSFAFGGDDGQGGFGETNMQFSHRPIVYLKSTVQTSGQDSTGAWKIIDK